MQTSTEYGGVGQSGYTAGRVGDAALALQLEARNSPYAPGADEDHAIEIGDDDRWRAAGRRPWIAPALRGGNARRAHAREFLLTNREGPSGGSP
jgi:hypothetical protein